MRVRTTETVTIVRVTLDGFGDPTASSSIDVPDCAVLPRTTGDEIEGFDQDIVNIDMTVVVPSGTDVRVTDQMTVRGETYRVSLSPIALVSPFSGRDSGIGVQLRRTTG